MDANKLLMLEIGVVGLLFFVGIFLTIKGFLLFLKLFSTKKVTATVVGVDEENYKDKDDNYQTRYIPEYSFEVDGKTYQRRSPVPKSYSPAKGSLVKIRIDKDYKVYSVAKSFAYLIPGIFTVCLTAVLMLAMISSR